MRMGQTYYTWGNAPGDTYAVHTHTYTYTYTYRKQLICLAGSITFMLPATGEQIELHPGDEFDLPPGTPHGAVVGPRGVRCAEAHLPSSEGTRSPAK